MSNFKPCFFNCGRKNKKGDAKMKGKKLLALLMAATIGTTLFRLWLEADGGQG